MCGNKYHVLHLKTTTASQRFTSHFFCFLKKHLSKYLQVTHYILGLGNSCRIVYVTSTYKCKCTAFVTFSGIQKSSQAINMHSFILALDALLYFYFIFIYFIFSSFYNFLFLCSFSERTLGNDQPINKLKFDCLHASEIQKFSKILHLSTILRD